jgi:APA family basic amino acid/polyamine antiporter
MYEMLNAERPYKAFMYPFLPAFLYHSTSAICIALIVQKTSTSGWGVLIMLLGIPPYYLTKAKSSYYPAQSLYYRSSLF